MSKKKFNIDHQVIGAESSLSPFLQCITSARQAMFASQLKQATHVHSEPPCVSSGFEYQFDKLQLNPTLIEESSTLIGFITKPMANRYNNAVNYTVFYYTNRDRIVKYFDIDSYTLLNGGSDFCYRNNIQNTNLIMFEDGAHLPAGISFSKSPSSINGMCCLGVNAKAIYVSHADLLNDSVILSEDLANKLETIGCKEYTISLSETDIPLNIHGSYDDYRILPEMGDLIDNGILFAYRPANDLTVASDLSLESLTNVNHLHDNIFNCPKDSTIVHIDVYLNPNFNKLMTIKRDPKLKQFYDIYEKQTEYFKSILEINNLIKERELNLSPEMNSLITHAMGMLKVDKHAIKDMPVDFIECKIVVAFPRPVNAGNKITCRAANKGVIAANGIWPNENMPITEDGIRADIIISDNSPFNRLNPGQWYEQFINYASEIIRQRINDGLIGDFEESFNYIVQLKDIIAKTDKEILERLGSSDPKIKEQVIKEIKESPIYHCIPPFSKEISTDIFMEIMDKFNINKVNWSFINPLTGEKIYSKYPSIVGDKYIYLLGKLPENSVHVVQVGYLNQLGLPMKETKSSKQKNSYSNTVIRFGVDESCITSASVPTSSVVRWMCINGNSIEGVKELQRRLSTDSKPTQLFRINKTTKDMMNGSTNVAIMRHLMNCSGLTTSSNLINDNLTKLVTEPFKVTDVRRKKNFDVISDSPHLIRITLNDNDDVQLSDLYNFKIVKEIITNKRSCNFIKLYFSDGSCCRIKRNLGIMNFILWEVYINFYVIPSKEDIFIIKNVKKSLVSGVYTKIYYKLFNRDDYIFILERIWININFINNFNSLYLPKYNSTLCGIDIANTIKHPEMQKIISRIPDEKIGMGNVEKILKSLTDETINKILDGTIPSELKKFLETDSLNIQQVGQMLIAFGPRDDIDGEIPRYTIKNSCFNGLKSVEDFATESLSVKKSAYYNKSSIEEAGVFGKHFRIVGESQLSLIEKWCGNEYTSRIFLKPEWRTGFLDRVIIVDGEPIVLKNNIIDNFLGKEVELVSGINCRHEFGICERCAGYGDPGVLRKFTIPGTIIGTVASSQVNKGVMQLILSNKHLNKTDSFIYNLLPEAMKYMEKRSGNIYWKPGVESIIRKCSLKIEASKLGKLDDIALDIKAPDSWSSIHKIILIDSKTEEEIDKFVVKDSVIIPFLSSDILLYMKKIYDEIQLTPDDFVIIPMKNFNFNKSILKYNLMNQDMRAYVKKAKSFFNSQISKLNEKDVLESAYDLIYSKTFVPSYFIDIVIKSYRRHRIEKEGKLYLKFLNTAGLLDVRDISGKMRHERMNMWLNKTSTYTDKKTPSISDVFFNF